MELQCNPLHYLSPPMQKMIIKARFNWFMMITESSDKTMCLEIQNQKIWGSVIMFGDRGVALFTPYNKRILITNDTEKKYFDEYFVGQNWIKKRIKYVKHLMSAEQIKAAKNYYKYHHRGMAKDIVAYKHIIQQFKQIEIKQNQANWHECYVIACEAYNKSKDIVKSESTTFKVQALLYKSRAQLKLCLFGDSIHNIIKGMKYVQNVKIMHELQNILKQVNIELGKMEIHFDIKKLKTYHYHYKYPFHYHGYKMLKRNAVDLKKIVKKRRTKRCEWCHLLSRNNKKCKRCRKIFYCTKKCQKLHWLHHHRFVCM